MTVTFGCVIKQMKPIRKNEHCSLLSKSNIRFIESLKCLKAQLNLLSQGRVLNQRPKSPILKFKMYAQKKVQRVFVFQAFTIRIIQFSSSHNNAATI